MPCDPAQLADHSPLNSQVMRNQLNALNDKIDAVPAVPPGPQGSQGDPGPQGPAGEVTAQQLNDGLAAALATAAGNSSANTNAVALLEVPFVNDPPTLADIEVLRAKVNELIHTLRR